MALITNERYSLLYQRINLIYQKPEIKASLEVILSVFTVTALIFAAIRPTLTNIASLQKKIEDLNSFNLKADNKIAQVFNAQTQLNTYRDKLRLFDEAVPDKLSYYDMAGRIEVLAKKRGLISQTIVMPGTRLFGTGKGFGDWTQKIVVADQNGILKTRVSFTVSGKPVDVKNFLIDIENMDRLALLDNIILSTEPSTTQGESVLKATGDLNFYFFEQT